MYNLLKRIWIPLLIVVVVAIAGLTVARIRTFFGANDTTGISNAVADDTKPFNPKIVKYEIYGVDGATADINYLDLNAQPQRVDGAALPWSLTLTSTVPAVCGRRRR